MLQGGTSAPHNTIGSLQESSALHLRRECLPPMSEMFLMLAHRDSAAYGASVNRKDACVQRATNAD